ncbi:hypothetical protein D3C86_1272070 [compost metagenome]
MSRGLGIGQPGLQVPCDDVAGLEFLPRRRGPVLIRRHHQLAGHQGVDVGLERQLQPGRRAVGVQQPVLALIEVNPAVQQHGLHHAVSVAQDGTGDADISLLAGEDLDRLIDALAALHQAHGARIARVRQRALAEVARDQQSVLVDPVHAALGFRQIEAAVHKGFRHAVELADRHRVLAAVRQGQQAIALFGRQAGRALVDPVCAFGGRQSVDVEDGLPLRSIGAIGVQRRATPDAAHVPGVLPEVVDVAVVGEARRGDAVARLDDVQRLLMQGLIARVALQHAQRGRVVGLDPVRSPSTVDFLKPQIGVGGVAGREARRSGSGCGRVSRMGHDDGCGSGGEKKGGGGRQRADHVHSPTQI